MGTLRFTDNILLNYTWYLQIPHGIIEKVRVYKCKAIKNVSRRENVISCLNIYLLPTGGTLWN